MNLKLGDADLANKIDEWGWFCGDGYDAVLDAFIETQDLFPGDPHRMDPLLGV